jgi:hypothetical protein
MDDGSPGNREVMTEGSEDPREHATVDRPLNGPKRSALKPLLVTVALFATLAILYLLAVEFLIPAD